MFHFMHYEIHLPKTNNDIKLYINIWVLGKTIGVKNNLKHYDYFEGTQAVIPMTNLQRCIIDVIC